MSDSFCFWKFCHVWTILGNEGQPDSGVWNLKSTPLPMSWQHFTIFLFFCQIAYRLKKVTVNKWGVWGLNSDHYIYMYYPLPSELSSTERLWLCIYNNTWEILYSLYVNIQWNLHLLSWLHFKIASKKMVTFNDITFFN